jgi:dienelactone hydrolase
VTRISWAVCAALVAAGLPAHPARGQEPARGDQWLSRPVDDRTFRTFLDFFTYDRQTPFGTQSIDAEEHEGIRREHVSFQSTPGTRVTAHFYRTVATGAGRGSAVILLHGGSAPGKDVAYTAAVAQLLGRAGFDVLSIDMPYFGERRTDLLTTFTEQEKHDRLYNQPPAYLAWVTQIVKDVGRSLDWLVAERGVDPRRIGIVGISRGAVEAVIAGGADGRLAAVVLIYGGHFDALENGHLAAACPANYIGHISPRPLLMINGTQDNDMVRETSVVPLYRLARAPREILWDEGGHRGVPTEEHQTAMLQWLREKLR